MILQIFQDLCLSGPIEVATSLIGTPNLLINKKYYSPVLCLSSVTHSDPRLICCFKSYGRHLEFWCLSQMLSKTKKQVSEQWSGGLSFFTEYLNLYSQMRLSLGTMLFGEQLSKDEKF